VSMASTRSCARARSERLEAGVKRLSTTVPAILVSMEVHVQARWVGLRARAQQDLVGSLAQQISAHQALARTTPRVRVFLAGTLATALQTVTLVLLALTVTTTSMSVLLPHARTAVPAPTSSVHPMPWATTAPVVLVSSALNAQQAGVQSTSAITVVLAQMA